MSLFSEIMEQPSVLQAMFRANEANVKDIAAQIKPVNAVFIAARGTSDNAARYAQYVWGAFNRLPVMLATPSLFSIYQKPPTMRDMLVVGISQSGQSPDIVNVLLEARRQGQTTLAITNAPESPLAEAADHVLDIYARPENAVAATKTYTSQLQAIAMLAAALSNDVEAMEQVSRIPIWAAEGLQQNAPIQAIAQRYRYMDHCSVLGRGFNYATAFEWSLKLKELTYVVAEPYSSADFRHGPIAMVDRGFPVMCVAPDGAVFPDMLDLIQVLRKQHHAELLVISNREEALSLATSPIQLPADIPEWLSPIVGIIPAQLFCYHLTQVKGFDVDQPRGLSKVTKTT